MVAALSHTVAGNIADVRGRIRRAAERARRDPAEVTLIAVSKTFPAEAVAAAVAAGLRDIGENRVQEAEAKRAEYERLVAADAAAGATRATWHLIGHLQTNKVKTALRVFDILHSIDSLRLAEAVNRAAAAPVDVLIEVNVAGEATKSGCSPAEALGLVNAIGRLDHLRPVGLMTIAPMVDDPQAVRPIFRQLRELRDAAGLRHLSMGMTDDFEVAVEEGATMVRVGRAIFGAREART